MEQPTGPKTSDTREPPRIVPTGGVPLREERLRLLGPRWEALARSLRRLDDVSLGDAEPATMFIWRRSQS